MAPGLAGVNEESILQYIRQHGGVVRAGRDNLPNHLLRKLGFDNPTTRNVGRLKELLFEMAREGTILLETRRGAPGNISQIALPSVEEGGGGGDSPDVSTLMQTIMGAPPTKPRRRGTDWRACPYVSVC